MIDTILLTLSYPEAACLHGESHGLTPALVLFGAQVCVWIYFVTATILRAKSLDSGLSLEKLPQPPNVPDPELISPLQLI